MIRVYLAHTYGRRHGLSDEECERNAYKSIEWGRKLIDLGFNPFIPNLYHFVHKNWSATKDEEVWLEMTVEWLRQCDALFVAELPEWEDTGVRREIDVAKEMGIPIYYSLEELREGE